MLTIRLIRRREAPQFDFGLPTPPRMAYTFASNMHLKWDHDKGEWDPFSILGSLTLQGDVNGKIHDDCLILDSWLIGFARGLLELRSGASRVSVDTTDEPEEIHLRRRGEGFEVSWRHQLAEVSALDLACSRVASTLQALADDLRIHAPPRDERAIDELHTNAIKLANKSEQDDAYQRPC